MKFSYLFYNVSSALLWQGTDIEIRYIFMQTTINIFVSRGLNYKGMFGENSDNKKQ